MSMLAHPTPSLAGGNRDSLPFFQVHGCIPSRPVFAQTVIRRHVPNPANIWDGASCNRPTGTVKARRYARHRAAARTAASGPSWFAAAVARVTIPAPPQSTSPPPPPLPRTLHTRSPPATDPPVQWAGSRPPPVRHAVPVQARIVLLQTLCRRIPVDMTQRPCRLPVNRADVLG